MRLYRASDLLMRHRAAIEEQLFSSIQKARNERRLLTASRALKGLAVAAPQDVMRGTLAVRAAKSFGPTRLFQRLRTLFLCAKLPIKFRQG